MLHRLRQMIPILSLSFVASLAQADGIYNFTYVAFVNTASVPITGMMTNFGDVSNPLKFECGPSTGVVVSKAPYGQYGVQFTLPAHFNEHISSSTSSDKFCKFTGKFHEYTTGTTSITTHFRLQNYDKVATQFFYRGSVVARTFLNYTVKYPSGETNYIFSSDNTVGFDHYGGSGPWCNEEPSQIPTLSFTLPQGNIDFFSMISGKPTASFIANSPMKRESISDPSILRNCSNGRKYSTSPNFAIIKISPQGIGDVQSNTSYVEVVNQTDQTMVWGYTDNYPYLTNSDTYVNIPSLDQDSGANAYVDNFNLPLAAHQTSYIQVPKTDTYSLGIQAGTKLYIFSKSKDMTPGNIDASTGKCSTTISSGAACTMQNSGKVAVSAIEFNPALADNKPFSYFRQLPGGFTANNEPVSICVNVDHPLDLVDGTTLMLQIYNPTKMTKPQGCYGVDPAGSFNSGSYSGGE